MITISTKKKLKFENCKICFEATQLENKINHLEKNQIDVDSLTKYHKEFIKNKKLVLITQQRFLSERHNVFNRENFQMMRKKSIKERNSNWPQILDHPYRILIIVNSGCGKANSSLNLISHQQNLRKIWFIC